MSRPLRSYRYDGPFNQVHWLMSSRPRLRPARRRPHFSLQWAKAAVDRRRRVPQSRIIRGKFLMPYAELIISPATSGLLASHLGRELADVLVESR